MLRCFFIASLSFLFLVSCTTDTTLTTEPEVVVSPTLTSVSSQINPTEPGLTVTKVDITPTPTVALPVPTPTNTPIPVVSCQENISTDSGPLAQDLEGVIAYYDYDLNGVYIVGGIPLAYSQLPIASNANLVGFSPNGEWLLYEFPENPPRIGLISHLGNQVEYTLEHTLSGLDPKILSEEEKEWVFAGANMSGWLNDELVYVSLAYSPTPGYADYLQTVLDPFDNVWHPEFREGLTNVDASSSFSISPDLTRALFMQEGPNLDEDKLVLWDFEKQIPISNLGNRSESRAGRAGASFISWAPDSSKVAYPRFEKPGEPFGPERFVVIGRDGEDDTFNMDFLSEYSMSSVHDLTWSSNGKYLAFTLSHSKDITDLGYSTIFVYDTDMDQFVFQCLTGEPGEIPIFYLSPNSRYLAYTYSFISPLWVVDLQTGTSIKLAEKAVIGGWSDNFPSVWPP